MIVDDDDDDDDCDCDYDSVFDDDLCEEQRPGWTEDLKRK